MIEPIKVTPYSLASRFIGTKETEGISSNPMILAMLQLDQNWPTDETTPWCSAFLNFICWLLRLPRSKSLVARSWLGVGRIVQPRDVEVGFDICIFSREGSPTAGHVGFYAGVELDDSTLRFDEFYVLGGNQSNSVSIAPYPVSKLLGIRRLSL